ncbi:MAG: HEPN domain-containing protein [Prevotella sp.]|nr:HEPN domain-containing protein [Prevotella sp.]
MDKQLLVSLQIAKSHKFLNEADEMVKQQRWDLAANRYYYACFHIVQAAFISRGISTKTHDGCLTELGKNFILTGNVNF